MGCCGNVGLLFYGSGQEGSNTNRRCRHQHSTATARTTEMTMTMTMTTARLDNNNTTATTCGNQICPRRVVLLLVVSLLVKNDRLLYKSVEERLQGGSPQS